MSDRVGSKPVLYFGLAVFIASSIGCALAGSVEALIGFREAPLATARRLQESCLKMWNVAGVEPEVLDYRAMKIRHAGYPLRPEIMESAYTLYVKTQDRRYLDMGRTFFESLVRHCRAGAAYTTLKNVETKEQGDLLPSYFLAETLKYLYLLYASPETLLFDDVVFNTEAHPYRRKR